jgi:hypothetical protein
MSREELLHRSGLLRLELEKFLKERRQPFRINTGPHGIHDAL